MYKCSDCKQFFEQPHIGRMEQETGYTPMCCPHCGGEFFEEAHECACQMNYTTQDFCEDCYEKVQLTLDKLKEELGFKQGDFEDIIGNHFGW